MKKIILTLITVIAFGHFSYAQWASSGTNIYKTNSGNVGIGTTTPRALLEVTHDSTASSWIYMSNSGRYGSTVKIGSVISNSRQEGQIQYQNNFGIFDENALTSPRIYIDANGNVGIGTSTPGSIYKLAVKGTIHSQQFNVDLTGWSDYVLRKDYHLPTLSEVKTYIDKNQHLPEIPSEQQVLKDGLNVGEMDKLLVKKVEELTLYLIESDKKAKEQDQKIHDQEQRIKLLETKLDLLLKR